MLIDVAEIEDSRIEVPADGLLGYHNRRRQEAAFGADLNPIRSLLSPDRECRSACPPYWFGRRRS